MPAAFPLQCDVWPSTSVAVALLSDAEVYVSRALPSFVLCLSSFFLGGKGWVPISLAAVATALLFL
eukprot:12653448-Prorocentrum_lima.AAC.1